MSLNKSYITKFEVKNFKKFDHLTIDNLGEFNLITGDNNVGKTSLLEAFVIIQDEVDTSLEYLHRTLCVKNLHIHPKQINRKNPVFPSESYFPFLKNVSNKPIEFMWSVDNHTHSLGFQDFLIDDLKESDFEKQKSNNYNVGNTKYWVKIFKNGNLDELQWMYLDDFKRGLKYGYWELITYNAGFAYDVNTYYIENIGVDEDTVIHNNDDMFDEIEIKFKTLDFDQKKVFLNTLSLFVTNIEDTTIRDYYGRDMLAIKTNLFEDYRPITFWGEGFNKFVRYLLEIIKCQGRKILIDEIDTGVHWTKLEGFWKDIMLACRNNNVQLFATTHSLECVNAFVEAAKHLDFGNELRLIELEEAKILTDRSIYASTYNIDQIQAGILSEVNLRGGTIR